jgi:hypothetical protein
MKIKLIACEVFSRELRIAAAQSEQLVDCTFLPFGLHSTPNDLRARIQSEIDSAEASGYDYIVLGYCLCSRGTVNLSARSIPIVIPRAHDCITMFLGSRDRYSREFIEHPGTYYYSPGWIERSDGEIEQGYITETKERQLRERYVEYIEKYGEDNAKFLIEQESQWLKNYTRAAFINMNVGNIESYRDFVCRVASSHAWEYQEIEGDMSLIYQLVSGQWHSGEFLIVMPGEQVIETFDDLVIGIWGPE